MNAMHVIKNLAPALIVPAAFAGAALTAPSAHASALMWDTNHNVAGDQAGDGTWNTTNQNFLDEDKTPNENVAFDSSRTALFNFDGNDFTPSNGPTVTVSEDIDLNSSSTYAMKIDGEHDPVSTFTTTNASKLIFDNEKLLAIGGTYTFDVPIELGTEGAFSTEHTVTFSRPISGGNANSPFKLATTFGDDGIYNLEADNTYVDKTQVRNAVTVNLSGSLANSIIQMKDGVFQGVENDPGTLNFNLDGDNHDLIQVGTSESDSGNTPVLDIANLNLDIDATGTQTLSEYEIATINSANGVINGGTFNSVSNLPDGYQVQYNPDSITLTAVPEPTSLTLLGLGGMLVLGATRRGRGKATS